MNYNEMYNWKLTKINDLTPFIINSKSSTNKSVIDKTVHM
jgi:hypothetical protein